MYYTLIAIALCLFHSCLYSMDWKKIVYDRIWLVKNKQADKSILNKPIKLPYGVHPFSPLRLAAPVDYELMKEMLEAGADPNANDEYGNPLECLGSLREVALFLHYGASLTNCSQGRPLSRIFDHYSALKKAARPYNKQFHKDEIACLQKLIDAGANVNEPWNNNHPIMEIINKKDVSSTEKKAIIALLMSKGCDPTSRISLSNQQTVMAYYKNRTSPDGKNWYNFLRNKYYYPKARQFLIACYKEEGSPASTLPLELVHIIGKMVMGTWKG